MLVRFTGIHWDTSGGEDDQPDQPDAAFLGLPTGVTIEVEENDEFGEFEDAAVDALSKKYGYLVDYCDSFEVIRTSLELALCILEPFKEAGDIYDSYQKCDLFSDEQYEIMLVELQRLVAEEKAKAVVG